MYSTRVTVSEKLAAATRERDLLMFQINSQPDAFFTKMISEHPNADSVRDIIITVSIREDNIKAHAETGRLNCNSKELHTLLKMSDAHRLLHYLHSLDDASLLSISSGRAIRGIISDNVALSHRFSMISAQ